MPHRHQMSQHKIIRIEADQLRLDPLDLDPADFQSPLPAQNYRLFFSDEALGMAVGVWDTTTMQEAFGPYPGDEFIMVLDGSFAIVDADNAEVIGQKGQSACFRNGIPVSWKQQGYLRKIYLTLLDPQAEQPQVASASGGVVVLDPRIAPASLGSAAPLHGSLSRAIVFQNDTGNMLVTQCSWAASQTALAALDAHELVQVLQGSVTVIDEGGEEHHFAAGSAFFVPMGTPCIWQVTDQTTAWHVAITAP
jgi:uncharacterized cupin superfamily protein